MAAPAETRRLAAILAADVVGYSRMMRDDESGTLSALKRHRREIFDPAVETHRGRIVKLMGDGALVEFASAVDAVNCAVAVQRMTHEDAADGPGLTLRIGVNIGDVIIDGDDIYGDGVNIAARLEAVAEPGGVCVSSIVNDSVGARADVVFTDGGNVTVKNIDQPIRIWKWRPADDAAAPRATPDEQPRRPEKASIAVLAFDNLSGDPEQEYFSDGMTEDIITDLSKIGGLLVIARNSSFAYKGKTPDIRAVGRELGVAHVLEGSVRRAGARLRITAQLIDAGDGAHLWAERYDRELTDIFAVQDDVTRRIVDALKVKLTPAEDGRIGQVPTRSIEAHDLFLRGREALLSSANTRDMFDVALQSFNRAIELDPDYADPYVGLAHAYNRDFQNKWLGRDDSMALSQRYCSLALEKDPDLPYAHYVAGLNKFWAGDMAASAASIERALSLNPNFAPAIGMRALEKIYAGRPLEGIPDLKLALRLEPIMGHQFRHFIGTAYLIAGDYENAVTSFRQRIEASPTTDLSRGLMIAALGRLGRVEEARQVRDELSRLKPDYSFAEHIGRLPFQDPADRERIREGYALAGLED
ncbi:adenylate/guanylate cyclase domain-containing protein [Hoeflea sp. WL0058]|uniref:Adenylate/guanylate cyclase domain-containing protein n=1 Tax=Flavimaribacter sediminis TaxID=2865987 RepID=A0AAE2ZLQ7_9HYPH|nr:adenylate/guanylate cyclase domain-containing protein [Flavimaribacter sediminis]MBW8636658.1 adenylate/guanylate cyclase domain-containing protein [Flavimaribacter sediminis]